MYPSGNTTAVVFDPLPIEDRRRMNTALTDAWEKLDAKRPMEQCCAITSPTNLNALGRVEMFGGEFCGNATRSVIQLLSGGKDCEGTIEASGVGRPLAFAVKDGDVSLEIPLAREGAVSEVPEGYVVRLEGIVHLVVVRSVPSTDTPRAMLQALLADNRYGFSEEAAAAVTFFDFSSSTAQFTVWVKNINTMFDETACGSGTAAIGTALAFKEKATQRLSVIQPTGQSIQVEASYKPDGETVWISGPVATLYDNALEIDL